MFTKLKAWFIGLLMLMNIIKPAPSAAKEGGMLLKLDLQFFADGDDGSNEEDDQNGSGEGDEEDEDDTPNLEELLKNPKFKQQYNTKFKDQLNKRMKKYEGIDPEELRQLKEKAGKKGKDDEDLDKDKDTSRDAETEKRLLRAERREKTALAKEFAVENGHNPKLVARLMNIDAIELDDEGDAENLEELFEELEKEFPEYFSAKDDTDDEEEKQPKKRAGLHSLPHKKTNPKKKVDPADIGRQKAWERHKKKEDK